MASEENITQLETVYGSLRPHRTYGAVSAASGPFTGRDVLDATYGYGERIPRALVPCACGSELVIVPENRRPTCGRCSGHEFEGFSLVLEEDLPGEITAKLGDARYEYFANLWWRLDRYGDRVRPIRKPAKVAQLDRISGRFVPPKATERPEKEFWMAWRIRGDGALRQHKTYTEPVCSCLTDQEMHDAYVQGLAGTFCPVHGATCAQCGADHFYEDE